MTVELDEFFIAFSGCPLVSLLLPCVYSDHPAELMHVLFFHLPGEVTVCPYSLPQEVLHVSPLAHFHSKYTIFLLPGEKTDAYMCMHCSHAG